MSIINHGTSQNSEQYQAPVFEGYGEDVGGSFLAFEESFTDRMEVMELIYAADALELGHQAQVREAAGDESRIAELNEEFEVAQEATLKSAWDSVIKFFTNLWGRLVAFTKNVIMSFNALILSNKKFADKYGKVLKEKGIKTLTFEMPKYSNLHEYGKNVDIDATLEKLYNDAVHVINSGTKEQLNALADDFRKYKKDNIEMAKGKALGTGGAVAGNFNEAIAKHFRGGSLEESEVTVNTDTVLSVLSDTESVKKAEEYKKALDKGFGKIIKDLNGIKSKVKEGEDKEHNGAALSVIRMFMSSFSEERSANMAIFRGWKSAWTDRNSDYKGAILKGLKHPYTKRNGSNSESA